MTTQDTIEIEMKSLLGTAEHAKAFRQALLAMQPRLQETSAQLNHYFMGGDIQALYDQTQMYIAEHERTRFQQIALRGSNFSVRTRQLNQLILLIVKASIDDTTSANGISRLEFEAETPSLTLDQLDARVLSAGYTYQAKWSRQREQYQLGDVTVCLDKNAGYGYLAEFEIVVQDAAHVDTAKAKITTLMAKLHAAELPQDRLERMFAHYNLHWYDYYGTDKVFTVL